MGSAVSDAQGGSSWDPFSFWRPFSFCGCVIKMVSGCSFPRSQILRDELGSVWDKVPLLCCEHNHHPRPVRQPMSDGGLEKGYYRTIFVEELDMEEWHFSSLVGASGKWSIN